MNTLSIRRNSGKACPICCYKALAEVESLHTSQMLSLQEQFIGLAYKLLLHRRGLKQWRSQPKHLGGAKMFDFRRITLFCLEKRLSKHKMTIFSKRLGGSWPLWLPLGYACGLK